MPFVPPHLEKPLQFQSRRAPNPDSNAEFCPKKSTSLHFVKNTFPLLTSSILDLLSDIPPPYTSPKPLVPSPHTHNRSNRSLAAARICLTPQFHPFTIKTEGF